MSLIRKSFWVLLIMAASMSAQAEENQPFVLDRTSYSLGAIGAFSEMVLRDVKKLALGSPMSSSKLDLMMPEITKITDRYGVNLYRETDFLVTDLFPAELTDGKELVLVYKGDTLTEYLALKERKQILVSSERWIGEERIEVAREFGEMLSYPKPVIDELLSNFP